MLNDKNRHKSVKKASKSTENAPKRGKFITFEGLDGSGKTTQSSKLVHYLLKRGITAVCTKEPGATTLGRDIRNILLHDGIEMTQLSELFMIYADRAEHTSKFIVPNLNCGVSVVSDRYIDSTYAYQYAMTPAVNRLNELMKHNALYLEPDLTVLLDVPSDLGRSHSDDRYESRDASYRERVRNRYLDLANDNPERFVVVDATQELSVVWEQVKTHVDLFFQI